jgi:hypothetical protein
MELLVTADTVEEICGHVSKATRCRSSSLAPLEQSRLTQTARRGGPFGGWTAVI